QQAAGNIWTDDCPKPTHTHLNLFNYPNDMYVDPSIYFVYYGHFEDLQDKEGSRPFCATDWWNNDNTNYPCQTEMEENSCETPFLGKRPFDTGEPSDMNDYVEELNGVVDELETTIASIQEDFTGLQAEFNVT